MGGTVDDDGAPEEDLGILAGARADEAKAAAAGAGRAGSR